MMNLKEGFPPIARKDARVLILGSMPGEESLRRKEYYANPRNSFWRIMATLLGFDPELKYKDKIIILKENKIALWDVMRACERNGSLDTNIESSTIIENDFEDFYSRFQGVRNVFFNGAKAEHEYHKKVLPVLSSITYRIKYQRLSSTSPALARLSHNDKLREWSVIKNIF
jgi:double-stranded uracil-DNA glycosylase